jgi:peptidoglycan/LPS O-acetylase OafA/YrhL
MTSRSTALSAPEDVLAETPLAPGQERAFLSLAEPDGSDVTQVGYLPVANERLGWDARTGVVEGPAPTIEDLIRSLNVAYALIERPSRTDMPLRYAVATALIGLGLAASAVAFFVGPSIGLSPVYGLLGAVGFLGLMLVVCVAARDYARHGEWPQR